MIECAGSEICGLPELHITVCQDVQRVGQLVGAFLDGPKVLQPYRFAAGSHFVGLLLSIEHRIAKFTDQLRAIRRFRREVREFTAGYRDEYLLLLFMAFLDVSFQCIVGRTYSRKEHEAACAMLV
jgi:hypothetical protein